MVLFYFVTNIKTQPVEVILAKLNFHTLQVSVFTKFIWFQIIDCFQIFIG